MYQVFAIYPPNTNALGSLCFKHVIICIFTIVLFLHTPPLAFSSDSQDWLDDYQKNGGVFKPETHTVYPNQVMQPSGFVVASTEMLYKVVGTTRKPLDWTDIQPKLVNQNTPQSEAMAAYKEYAHFAGNFMIFHLFAVPKVLVGFSDEDRAMISSKWGIETHHIPKDGDYVELIYSTENRWGGSSPSHHKITVNHKKIAELGSLNAYLKHKGFTFTPSGVEFTFENNKIDFNSRRDKIEIFNYVFNFLANDYTYILGNLVNKNVTAFKSDWKRIYNYDLGQHSPQFASGTVLAAHKNYKNALSELSKVHKFSFNKNGSVGGADIDGESFYVLEDILIPKSALDWNNAQVTLNRGDTYHKLERKWVGLTRKYLKGEAMSGDEVFMYLKARLNGFKDLSNGASNVGLPESMSEPDENISQRGKPKKQYTFHFYKKGGLGGSDFNNKLYINVNGLWVLYDDIEYVPGKWETFEVTFYSNKFYYRYTKKDGKDARGEELTGAEAYNYLVENMPTDTDTPPYLFRQIEDANSKIPNVPQPQSSQNSSQKAYKFAFDGIVGEYFKPIIVNSEKFYILSNILIPSSSWGWNGKITVTINKEATYHKTKFELFNNYQDRRIVKGQAMSGEEVFNQLKGALSSKGFEDLSN